MSATRHILVTRPGPAGIEMVEGLLDRGALVSHQAAILKTPRATALKEASRGLPSCDLVLISSPEVLSLVGIETILEHELPCAVVGSTSARKWCAGGARVVAEANTLRGLIAQLRSEEILEPGLRVLWPRGNRYQQDLAEELRWACELSEFEIYETCDAYRETELELSFAVEGMIVHFASPSALTSFRDALLRQGALEMAKLWVAQAIGPTTAGAIDPEEWRDLRISPSADLEAQLQALLPSP